MPVHRLLVTPVCIVCTLTLAACAGDARVGPTSPTLLAAPQGGPTARLTVQVDAICAGRESNIRVFVDLVSIGVTNPGDPGLSQMVAIGDHQLSAVSQRGTRWGPFPTTVIPGGRVERLGCMPADGI